MSFAAALRLELVRLALSRRWLLATLICAGAAVIACEIVAGAARADHLVPSAWDVHAALVNDRETAVYFGTLAFILLVGNLVSDDRKSGYATVVVPRVGDRSRWWLAKLAAVVVAAGVLQLLLLTLCLAAGTVLRGYSLSPAASSFAMGVARGGAAPFPESYGAGGVSHHLVIAGYLALAYGALATLLLAVSVRFSLTVLPVLATLVCLVADFLFLKQVNGWWPYSPGIRMLEGAHSGLAGPMALSWWSSLAYWGVLLCVSALIGGRLLRRTDL